MKTLALAFLNLAVVILAFGQQTAPLLVNAEIVFLTNEKLSGLFLQPGPAQPGKPAPKAEVMAGTHGRGEKMKYNGPSTLTLFSVATDAKGTEIRVPVTSVSLPAGKNELLIVILAGGPANAPRQYRAYAYDDSFTAAPSGSVRFLNLTPVPMFGRLGTGQIQVTGGVSMSETILGAASRRISLGYTLNGQALPIVDQAYEVDAQERLLIALLPPFARGSGLIRARIIRDSPPIVIPPVANAGAQR